MSLLSEVKSLVEGFGLAVETGVFSGVAPDEYTVITPIADNFELHADNAPLMDVQSARLSLFTKGNYTKLTNKLIRTFLAADFSITDRRYLGHEDDTGYHHYAIDLAKNYEWEE